MDSNIIILLISAFCLILNINYINTAIAEEQSQLPTPHSVQYLPNYSGKLAESQYTGYLPTSTNPAEYNNSNQLFYWLQKSRSATSNTDPLVLWLQGGPGCSGSMGLFWENGGYQITPDQKVQYNPYSWNSMSHLLMIDQPIGTGFSIINNSSHYLTDMSIVGKELYAVLYNFIKLFPEYTQRPFFITGESYAGKYIPYLATEIMNHSEQLLINLKGLAIGDGWTAPLIQTSVYADQAYNAGLIDENEYANVTKQFALCTELVNAAEWQQAQIVCDGLLNWIVSEAGNINVDDIRTFNPDTDGRLTKYLNLPAVQSALNVKPTVWSDCNSAVGSALSIDEMKPAEQLILPLVERYRVLLYSGQFDLNCGVVGTAAYIRSLLGDSIYLAANKRLWYDSMNPTEVSGYVRDFIVPGQAANLTLLIVSGAGHLVPKTQPKHALDMFNRFINYIPFN